MHVTRRTRVPGAALLAALLCFIPNGNAQEKNAPAAPDMGARELYYVTFSNKDKLPAVNHSGAQSSAAAHLGLRYNLLLVDATTGANQQVASSHVFRNGDCVALELQSNHSGYVYVLAKQSSGAWTPVLPSVEMPEETIVLDPGTKKRVPSNYCMVMQNPPGVESLFVVLSRKPADFYELYRGLRGMKGAGPAPASPNAAPAEHPAAQPAPMQIADARIVNDAVEKMAHEFGMRDISIVRVNQPVRRDEPRGAVYVVNSSSKPAATITTTIEIRHR